WDGDSSFVLQRRTRSRIIVEEEQTNARGEAQVEQVASRNAALPLLKARQRLSSMSRRLLLPGFLIAVIGPLIYFLTSASPKPAHGAPEIRSIAVLPFKPLGAHDVDEYTSISLADALITKLAGLKQIV